MTELEIADALVVRFVTGDARAGGDVGAAIHPTPAHPRRPAFLAARVFSSDGRPVGGYEATVGRVATCLSTRFATPASTPRVSAAQTRSGVQMWAPSRSASNEYAPYPVKANATAPAPYSKGTSIPLRAAKSPLLQWTLLAAIMTESMTAGPTGPKRPSSTSRPLADSPIPAARAMARPGRNPIDSKNPAVPAMPYPPNHPKSF